MTDLTIRLAEPKDWLAVMRVLDGANLESDASVVQDRIDDELVLVATDDGRVIAALVAVPCTELDASDTSDEAPTAESDDDETGAHVEAVAVRLRRRGQGIGTSLMRAAADRWRPLTADFYPGLSGFYEKLDFEVEKREGQYRGVLE